MTDQTLAFAENFNGCSLGDQGPWLDDGSLSGRHFVIIESFGMSTISKSQVADGLLNARYTH
jgi:hypothetical protein